MIATSFWTNPAGLVLSGFGFLVVLGAVYAFFRSGYGDKIIDQLKENNEALEESIKILERKVKTQAEEIDRLSADLDDLRAQNKALYQIVRDLLSDVRSR